MKLYARNTEQGLLPLFDSNIEVWKDIEGFEGYYQVSNLGRIKSLILDRNRRGKVLSPCKTSYGYVRIRLCKDFQKSVFAHRVVAEAFIPNPENKPYVNHKNGVKNDNRVENLEWVTSKENIRHAIDYGLKKPSIGECHGMHKLTQAQVIRIKKMYNKKMVPP